MRLTRMRNTAILFFVCLLFMGATAERAEAISGSGTMEDPYVLTTAADIAAMHNKLDAHYALGADIDMFGRIHDPIGNGAEGAFTGSLDGRGHTIRNLELELTDNKYVGLFGYLEGSVSNLKMEGVKIIGGRYTGAVAGNIGLGGSVTDCSILSGSISATAWLIDVCVGGITGMCEGALDRSSNAAAVFGEGYKSYTREAYAYVGGLVGRVEETLKLSNSENRGAVESSWVNGTGSWSSTEYYVLGTGGLIGQSRKGVWLLDCSNAGVIRGNGDTAGMIGRAMDETRLQRCSNSGNIYITDTSRLCGGLIAWGRGNITAEECTNSGDIFGENNNTGGIVGECSDKAIIVNCKNSGSISRLYSSYYSTGGIAGYLSQMEVSGCWNNGAISGGRYIAGIVGEAGPGRVSDCRNYGSITRGVGDNAGGIIAYMDGTITIEKCENHGDALYAIVGGGSSESRIKNCKNYGSATGFSGNGSCSGCVNYGRLSSGWSVSMSIGSGGGWSGSGGSWNAAACIMTDVGVALNGATSVYCSDLRYCDSQYYRIYRGYPLAELQDPTSAAYATWSLPGEWVVLEGKNSGLPLPADTAEMDLMDQSLLIMEKGERQTLNAPFEVRRWGSSSAAAGCKDGAVTAQNVGTAVVSAYDGTGRQANCVVFVYERRSAVTMRKTLTVTAGSNTTLTTDLPDEDPQGIIWSSSDTTVATVGQDGIVSAKKPGQAIITATLPLSGVSASCTVTVQGKSVGSLELSQTSATLQCGQTLTLTYTTGSQYDDRSVTWTSSNAAVAAVEDGTVTGVKPGVAVITCRAASGVEASCTVTVKQNGTSLTLDRDELSLELGTTARLTAALLPETSTDSILWGSTDSSVVSVDANGVLTPQRIGQAAVYAYTSSGLKASCTVTVYTATVWPETVTLSQRILRPSVGQEIQLQVELSPGNCNKTGIEWTTSDSSVAEVTVTGLVRAVGTGTAEIRATTENGLYDICTVKVSETSSAEFVVESGRISLNDTADTAVYLTKNPGIASFTMGVTYDAARLKPLAVRTGALLSDTGVLSSNVEDAAESGTLRVTWYSDVDIADDGELFVITWQAVAADGATAVIDLDYGEDDICNSEKITVPVRKEAGGLLTANYLVGDIYTDSSVNMKDIVYFARWFNGQENMSEQQEKAADVYYDGVLNVKDLTQLAQILSRSIVQQSSISMLTLGANDTEPFYVSVSDATTNESGEAEIIVSGSNCPGIAALRFALELPVGYDVLAVTPGDVLDDGNFRYDETSRSVMWYSNESQILEGTLFTIHVRAGAGSPERGEVRLNYEENDYFQAGTYVPVSIAVGYGSIERVQTLSIEQTWKEEAAIKVKVCAGMEKEIVFLVAYYDESGRMLQITTSRQTIARGEKVYTVPATLEGAANIMMFVVDAQNYTPLCDKTML